MAKKKLIKKSKARALRWITRDGRKLHPKQMSTAHLIATLRLTMWRARSSMLADSLDALAYAGSAPDGAAYAAECASAELMAAHDQPEAQLECARKTSPIVEALYKELKTRSLTINSVLL